MHKKAGVIGWPVEHSLSPAIHSYWLKQHAIDGSYKKFAVKPEELSNIIKFLEGNALSGVNVTLPHKVNIIPFLDGMDSKAKSVGAVNLVVKQNGKWIGHNTDIYGFTQNLLAEIDEVKKGTALILGAGGAARAAIISLKDIGFKQIWLCNRTTQKAEQLAKEFGVQQLLWNECPQYLSTTDLLVNTTSLGMKGNDELQIDLSNLPGHAIVYDIVYNPQDTALIRQARQQGNKTVGGMGMLMHQAAPAFSTWFGVTPHIDEGLNKKLEALL